ncbi:MAG: PhnD/SsuA/transferrin family substrate-binding protein, partial [Acidimicrobiales bacterium]
VFIANADAGIAAIDDVGGLSVFEGTRFTFGSESTTSGRLMPQYFLDQAGVTTGDFAGQAGYSGSHDATIAVVQAGTFEAGALNEQVWKARTESGQVDLTKVQEIFRTPAYHDYHWVLRPDVASRYPAGFEELLTRAFTDLDATDPTAKEILDLFGAKRFIPTQNSNYAQIEAVARRIGLLS